MGLPAVAAELRVVVGGSALLPAEPPAHPGEVGEGARAEAALVQRGVELRGRPGGERPALVRTPEAAAVQHVDRQIRPKAAGTVRRRLVGGVHPHLGEPPPFVHRQLVAPDVGGVIHLEDHVRQGVHPQHDGGVARPPDAPVQVDGLVGHQHLPRRAVLVPLHHVDGPGQQEARPALETHAGQQLAQQVGGSLVDGAGVAQDPRGPRLAQPVLDAPVVGPHVVPRRQRDGVAAGKVRVGGRRRRVRRDGACGAPDWRGDRCHSPIVSYPTHDRAGAAPVSRFPLLRIA